MLDNKGFDLWADGYDLAVGLSDEENTYPFAGYKEILFLPQKTRECITFKLLPISPTH